MKRTISLLLMVFVMLGVMNAQEVKYVSGGTARQMALGGSPNNAYVMDYTNVLTNPAWAIKYNDFVYSELGYSFAGYSALGQSAGFTYAVNKSLSVGLSIGNQEGPIFDVNSYGSLLRGNVTYSDDMVGRVNGYMTTLGFPALSTNTLRPIQAYGALKVSALTLGFAIYRTSWSASEDVHSSGDTLNTKSEASISQTGFKAGALLDLDAMLLDVSAMLRINSGSGKITPPPAVPSNNQELTMSGTEIALNARLFMKLSDKFVLVPMARFSTFGYTPEMIYAIPAGSVLNGKPQKYGRTDLEVGLGSNVTVPGGRIFAGLSLESISLKCDVTNFTIGGTVQPIGTPTETTKYSTSVLSLPKVSLGAEFDVASWLTGRIGYYKAFASATVTTEEPAPAKKEETTSTFDFQFCPPYGRTAADQLLSLGVGLHFDRLSIDAYLCEEWLADGPFILSGANADTGGNKMFGVVSLSYSFQ